MRRGDLACLREGRCKVRGGVCGDGKGVGGGKEVMDVSGAGVGDGGEKEMVVAAVGVGVCGGIEEGKEDARHLYEILVAEAGEDEGSGLGSGECGDGGTERPGSGGVVGYIEEEVGGEKFQTSGPGGVADSGFDGRV